MDRDDPLTHMKFIRNISVLNWVFIAELFLFALIIPGSSQEAALYLAGLAAYVLLCAPEDAVFIISLSLFFCPAFYGHFDNLIPGEFYHFDIPEMVALVQVAS